MATDTAASSSSSPAAPAPLSSPPLMGPVELLTTAAWVVPWLVMRALGYAIVWAIDVVITIIAFMVGLLMLDPENERMRAYIAQKNPILADELEGDPPLLKLACICESIGFLMEGVACAIKYILLWSFVVFVAFGLFAGLHQALSSQHVGRSVFFH